MVVKSVNMIIYQLLIMKITIMLKFGKIKEKNLKNLIVLKFTLLNVGMKMKGFIK